MLDEATLRRAAAQYGAMPSALRVFGARISQGGGSPQELFESSEVEIAVDALWSQSLAELPPDARSLLDQLAVLRVPILRTDLDKLVPGSGVAFSVLVQRLFVEFDSEGGTIVVTESARRIACHAMTSGTADWSHRRAAQYYRLVRGMAPPTDLHESKAGLEEVFHLVAARDPDSAALALLWAGPALLRWGYADIVEREARGVAVASKSAAAIAQSAFFLGEVADLQGRYDEAAAHFQNSQDAGHSAGLSSLVALALYRLGRIASARGRLGEAEDYLDRCLEACAESGVTEGWAGAMLSLAWVHRQRGASVDDVRQGFDAALSKARQTGDFQVEASAHRELGFLAWDRLGDEALAREHYVTARTISERQKEAKELGAVHAVLGYLEVQWGNVDAAADHSWEAIRIANAIGDSHMLATAYDHLGLAWEARGDFDGAAQWYQRSSQKEEQIGNPSGLVITGLHLAVVLRKQGRPAEAAAELTNARRLAEMYGLVDLQSQVAATQVALGEDRP